MKKLLFAICFFAALIADAQTSISALPTYTGDPSGGWVPVVVGTTTRKTDAKNLGNLDSLTIASGTTYDTLKVFKNGVQKYYKLIRAGSTFDTTSVYAAIGLKLNKTDTTAMLSPYLRSNIAAATYQPIGSYATTSQFSALQSNLDTTRTGIRADLNGKQAALSLTTTGSSGAATLVGNTLNIPQYSGGGGSTVTNLGLDSTGENFYGTLYDSTTWNNLSSFTNNGGTFTVTSNKIVGSGGANTTTQTLEYNYYTSLTNWRIGGKIKATATVDGFGLGQRSQYGAVAKFNAQNGYLYLYGNGSSAVLLAQSSSAVTFSTNDYIQMWVTREGNVITAYARNATTNGATVSVRYIYNYLTNTVPIMPNIGRFAIYSFGGSFTVDSLSITSKEVKNAKIAVVGDSKAVGYYAENYSTSYPSKLGEKYKSTIIVAGANETTADLITRLNEVIALNPKQVLLQIGSNDIRTSVSASTIYANYDTIYNRLTRAGILVFPLLPFKEAVIDQTGLVSHITSTYPTRYIDTYSDGYKSNQLADNVHPNQSYNDDIFDAIIKSGKLVGGNNAYPNPTNKIYSYLPITSDSAIDVRNSIGFVATFNGGTNTSAGSTGSNILVTSRGTSSGYPSRLPIVTGLRSVYLEPFSTKTNAQPTYSGSDNFINFFANSSNNISGSRIVSFSGYIGDATHTGSDNAFLTYLSGRGIATGSNNLIAITRNNSGQILPTSLSGAVILGDMPNTGIYTAENNAVYISGGNGSVDQKYYFGAGAADNNYFQVSPTYVEANRNGSNWYFRSSAGRGTGGGGNFIFQTWTAVGSGTTLQTTAQTELTIERNIVKLNNRFQTSTGADVASANDLTLGNDGNVFTITGTTQINAITTTNWQAGSEIILIFNASVTVKNNTAGGANTAVMLLAGGADFSATANDVLKLVYNGTSWFEVSRSVN